MEIHNIYSIFNQTHILDTKPRKLCFKFQCPFFKSMVKLIAQGCFMFIILFFKSLTGKTHFLCTKFNSHIYIDKTRYFQRNMPSVECKFFQHFDE